MAVNPCEHVGASGAHVSPSKVSQGASEASTSNLLQLISDDPQKQILSILCLRDLVTAARVCRDFRRLYLKGAELRARRFGDPCGAVSGRDGFQVLSWLSMVEPALTYHKHVAAGLAHTAVIDGAAVYSIGRGEIRPGALNCVRIETFPSEVLAVAAMHKSIVVLDREGQVWQGWASESACSAPLRMPSGASLHVEQLSCGLMHCLLLSSGGCVYSFGRNDEGALGRDVKGAASAEVPGAVPIRMPFTSGVLGDPNGGEPRSRVMHISAGRMHSLAVVAVPADPQEDPGTSASGGDPAVPALSLLYAWGEGMLGQMGQPQQASQYRPCLVAAEGMLDVCRVSGGAQHSLCVVKNGLAFSTGDASGGKCGIGALDGDPHTMQLVPWSRMRLPELGDDGIPEVCPHARCTPALTPAARESDDSSSTDAPPPMLLLRDRTASFAACSCPVPPRSHPC